MTNFNNVKRAPDLVFLDGWPFARIHKVRGAPCSWEASRHQQGKEAVSLDGTQNLENLLHWAQN